MLSRDQANELTNEITKFTIILLPIVMALAGVATYFTMKWNHEYYVASHTPGTKQFNERLADDEHFAYRIIKDGGKVISIEDTKTTSAYETHRYKLIIQDKNATVYNTLIRDCDITIKTDITDIGDSYSDDMGDICLPYDVMQQFN